jgi:hypothetical protein
MNSEMVGYTHRGAFCSLASVARSANFFTWPPFTMVLTNDHVDIWVPGESQLLDPQLAFMRGDHHV